MQAVLGYAGGAGLFSVTQQATSIMEVLIFGAGVDYTIFIVSRYREELLRTQDRHEAMRDTMRAVGEAIASSGTTVILSVSSPLACRPRHLQDFRSHHRRGPSPSCSSAASRSPPPCSLCWAGRPSGPLSRVTTPGGQPAWMRRFPGDYGAG